MTDESSLPTDEPQAPQHIPVLPLPMQDSFTSVRMPDGKVFVLHTVETPVGTFQFMRERDYHLEVMSNGRKTAGSGSIQIAPAGSIPT